MTLSNQVRPLLPTLSGAQCSGPRWEGRSSSALTDAPDVKKWVSVLQGTVCWHPLGRWLVTPQLGSTVQPLSPLPLEGPTADQS